MVCGNLEHIWLDPICLASGALWLKHAPIRQEQVPVVAVFQN